MQVTSRKTVRGLPVVYEAMVDILTQPAVQAALAVVVITVVGYVGFRVATALRHATGNSATSVEELRQNFEEMQREGNIDEAELRRIASVLGKTQESPPGS